MGFLFRRGCFTLVLLWLASCASPPRPTPPLTDLRPTVILISLDGFRWDYLDRPTANAPTLRRLASGGTRALHLVPIFPSVTFPNHYTLVTGLYAEHHGIVGNEMNDPTTHHKFTLGDAASIDASEWWGGEPLWVTVEKQQQHAATLFWVGSSAEIGGKRPSHWLHYDRGLPYGERVRQALQGLDQPVGMRPTFLTLYFEGVDSAGHEFGPESEKVNQAIHDADDAIAELWRGLEARGIAEKVQIVVVSDHGMITVPDGQALNLSRWADLKGAEVVGRGAVIGIFPAPGTEDKIYRLLSGAHPHFKIYRKNDIPARFHYRDHRRIAPLVCIADEGWYLSPDANLQHSKGAHGYDNGLPSMHGIFIAHGPAFLKGVVVESFENIHLYALLADVLGLRAAPNDGNLQTARTALHLTPLTPPCD
jgi:predicted AlkP superfamily pyrophosphatase or phosphodiesterase